MFNVRNISLAILALAACSATCFAQTPSTFKTQTYTQRPSTNPYAVDVNNDGILDLVQQPVPYGFVISTFKPAFTVRIANGDGSFRAPVIYSFPPSVGGGYGGTPMVSGDFNGDGNVDLIFEGTNQLLLYLGKGDGTFQAPKYITVDFPSGQQLGYLWLAADFNGDGKLDLIATGGSTRRGTPGSILLIPGDGAGGFAAPISIYTSPQCQSGGDTDSCSADSLLAGDFDGDGRPDIAFVNDYTCDQGQICSSTVHVLYNDGNSQFTDTTTDATVTYGGVFTITSTGDLNSDGRTDIFANLYDSDTSSSEFYVLYGQAGRAFHMYTIPGFTATAMADFNGDTRMDLVGSSSNSGGLTFLLATGSEGAFTQQDYAPPNNPYLSGQVVGDFNFDTKPDVVGANQHTTSTYVLSDTLNTTASGNWGGCAYPKAGTGIHVCSPGSSVASPVTFNAAANSFGQLRKIELWVDGKKVTEQFHAWGPRAWFNFSDTFASGTHRGVIIAADIDNHLQQTVFNFTVGGAACLIPSTAGVNICSPASGSTVTSPVQVEAAAKVNGTIARMELWVDGVKKSSVASTTLNTSVSLPAGTHRFAIVATNTAGQKWESVINATVK